MASYSKGCTLEPPQLTPLLVAHVQESMPEFASANLHEGREFPEALS